MSAQQVKAKAFTDSSKYLIGDLIKYTVQIHSPENVSVVATGFKDSIANVELISVNTPDEENTDNGKVTTFEYIISKYDSADVTIPSIPFYYREGKNSKAQKLPYYSAEKASSDQSLKSVYTNPVNFSVRLVKVDMSKEIKDVKEPITIPLDWKVVALLIAAAILIIGILYFLYRKYQAKKAGTFKPVIIIPPHITALNALKELEAKKLWQQGNVKEYHSEITGIIRKYFEDRFKIPALEITTSELMHHMKNIPLGNGSSVLEITYNFLSNADLVKFAKYTPLNTINEEMMKQAYEIVNITAAPIQPQTITEESNVQ